MSNATAVRERPIIMTGESVRAILGGSKSQTRRVVKPQPVHRVVEAEAGVTIGMNHADDGAVWYDADGIKPGREMRCPYGVVGDRLWVKETWTPYPGDEWPYEYRADNHDPLALKWRSPRFMPRAASRITLEITDVRVERVQDITPDDAVAEGLAGPITKDGHISKYGMPDTDGLPGSPGWPWHRWRQSPVDAYESLWDEINAKRHPWSRNPWIWCIAFRVLP